MKCHELLQALSEYVDGQADEALCEEFKQHLAKCNPCHVVIDNVKKTITFFKAGQPYELPLDFRTRLHNTLAQKFQSRFPQAH